MDNVENKCLIRCKCGSPSPDSMYNLLCDVCQYYVHGICYDKKNGPITCATCDQKSPCQHKIEGEESRWKALELRLSFSLSKGEHKYFFSEKQNNTISKSFLQLKFNIDKFLAEKVINSSLETGLLELNADGFVVYNDTNKTVVENKCKAFTEEKTSPSKHDLAHSGINNFHSEDNIAPRHCKAEETGFDDNFELKKEDVFTFSQNKNPADLKSSKDDEIKEDIDPIDNGNDVDDFESEIKLENIYDDKPVNNPSEDLSKKRTRGRPKSLHETGPYSCDLCDYVAMQKCSVKKHKNSIHFNIRHPCCFCDHSSTSKVHLKQHILSKHKGVRYNCDICEFSASDPSALRKHKIHLHEGKKYYCDQCDYVCSRQGILSMHMKNKHEGVVFMCDQCIYQAPCKSRLQHHKNSKHEGIRYPCNQCQYQALKNSDLRSHKRRVHEGVRYNCDICKYSASSQYLIKTHKESKHDGKLQSCPECNFTSEFSNKVKQHMISHHQGFRYSCDICTFSSTSTANINKHKRKLHNDIKTKQDVEDLDL